MNAARSAGAKTEEAGREYVDYWIGRLEFGIAYLGAVELVRSAARADVEGMRENAEKLAGDALDTVRKAIEAQVRVTRDQSDRGTVAVLNEHVYRPLRRKVQELESG